MSRCLARVKRTKKRCRRAGTDQGYCKHHRRSLFRCCGGNDEGDDEGNAEHCEDCPDKGDE